MLDINTRSAYHITVRSRMIYLTCKRCTDFIVSCLLILLTFPIFLCICYLLYQQEGRPIFYRKVCAGKDGEPFNMYVFRTKTERSKVIRAFPPHPYPKSWENGVPGKFLFQYSPMTTYTSLGSILAKYKLDKIPLLFHIFLGQMSFVGPKPEVSEIASFYNQKQRKRLYVKPGIIGYAQIKQYSSQEYAKQIYADLYYVKHCSYILDLKIIVRAISQTFFK